MDCVCLVHGLYREMKGAFGLERTIYCKENTLFIQDVTDVRNYTTTMPHAQTNWD